MYSGFCVRVLVLSLLTFGQYRNALCYKRGASTGIKPLFDYSRNHKLPSASGFESSAQPGGFLGSYGSSRSGRVDRYSPKGSVSSYGSSPLNIRKPTQNSQQPPQTNANGVIQAKAGMWDLVSPQNEDRFELGIVSSKGIIMKAVPQQPVGIQSKPAMWKFLSPVGGVSGPDVQPTNLNVHMTVPPRRKVPLSSRHRPRWQQSLVPV